MRKTALVVALLASFAMWPQARAQTVAYKATLNGGSEVPPVQTSGQGSAEVNVDPGTMELSWSVQYSGLSGPATAAHIHCGAAPGANAGVAVSFGNKVTSPITGSGKMTAAQLAELKAGKCYVNVHTAKNKGGEIRGQLAP